MYNEEENGLEKETRTVVQVVVKKKINVIFIEATRLTTNIVLCLHKIRHFDQKDTAGRAP